MADKKNKKTLGIEAVAIVDNIVFSKTDVWAYYRITNDAFDFLSQGQKVSLAAQLDNAYSNIASDRAEPVECHLIVTSLPVDIDHWEKEVRKMAEDNSRPAPGFDLFVKEQVEQLKSQQYMRKVAYIGVNLGKRGALDLSGLNVLEHGLKSAKETAKMWFSNALKLATEEVSPKEEANFRFKEENYERLIRTGNLQGDRATSEELLMFFKNQFYPTIPTPPLISDYEERVGAGDILNETSHAIENKYRWLKIVQMYHEIELTGYRATMTFAEFPKRTFFPLSFPFFYFPSKLGAPFTMYSRFFLTPSSKMKATIEKKRKEQKDELENVTAGQDQYDSAINGVPQGTQQAISDLNEISSIIENDKQPWVQGSYHIVVEAESEEALRSYCDTLKQAYDDLGIKLIWTAGDQKELLLESLPGDRIRSKGFKQTTNISHLSTSGANFNSEVGDTVLFEKEKMK